MNTTEALAELKKDVTAAAKSPDVQAIAEEAVVAVAQGRAPVLSGKRTYLALMPFVVPFVAFALTRLQWVPAGDVTNLLLWLSTPEAFAFFVGVFAPLAAWFRSRVNKPALPTKA